jgi:hypothetical protein
MSLIEALEYEKRWMPWGGGVVSVDSSKGLFDTVKFGGENAGST